jgi:glycosyltransferase involved in cell wall biosynthesis
MRIGHVINPLAPGGSEKQLTQLAGRSRLEHEIIELRPQESRRTMLRELFRALRGADPEVVVAWLDRPQVAVALTSFRWSRRPIVASVRGLPGRGTAGRGWALRAAFLRYHHLVANSHAVRTATRQFTRPFPLRPFSVIPNGVELPAAPPPPPRNREQPLRIGFIGRANPWKGLDVLLSALELIPPGEATAVLVGEGVPEAVRGRIGPVDTCRALPRTTDPWRALGTVDVLAVPSRSEGSPNVVIEAFAMGVPVVATAVGGTPELLLDRRGWLVPPEDPEALAGALLRVARDVEEAAERGARARLYAEKVHAWPRVATAWDELLAGMAERRL